MESRGSGTGEQRWWQACSEGQKAERRSGGWMHDQLCFLRAHLLTEGWSPATMGQYTLRGMRDAALPS